MSGWLVVFGQDDSIMFTKVSPKLLLVGILALVSVGGIKGVSLKGLAQEHVGDRPYAILVSQKANHFENVAVEFEALQLRSEQDQLQYEFQQQELEWKQIGLEQQQKALESKQLRLERLQIQAEAEGRFVDAQRYLMEARQIKVQAQGFKRGARTAKTEAQRFFESSQQVLRVAQHRLADAQDARQNAQIFQQRAKGHAQSQNQCPKQWQDIGGCQLKAQRNQAEALQYEAHQRLRAANLEGDWIAEQDWEGQALFWLRQKQEIANQLSLHQFLRVGLPMCLLTVALGLGGGFFWLTQYCRTADGRFDPLQGALGDFLESTLPWEQFEDLQERIQDWNNQSRSTDEHTWAFIVELVYIFFGNAIIAWEDWWDPNYRSPGSGSPPATPIDEPRLGDEDEDEP